VIVERIIHGFHFHGSRSFGRFGFVLPFLREHLKPVTIQEKRPVGPVKLNTKIHVFPRLAGHDHLESVPVIPRGDDDDVDVLVVENLSKVLVRLGLAPRVLDPLLEWMRRVVPTLIDSITREMVTGKRGNLIAGPAAAASLKKIQAVSTKRKAESAPQKADPLHSGSRLLTSDS